MAIIKHMGRLNNEYRVVSFKVNKKINFMFATEMKKYSYNKDWNS